MHPGHVLVKMLVHSWEILHHLSITLCDKVDPLLWLPWSRRISLNKRSMYDNQHIWWISIFCDCVSKTSWLLLSSPISSLAAEWCLLLCFHLRLVGACSTRTFSSPTTMIILLIPCSNLQKSSLLQCGSCFDILKMYTCCTSHPPFFLHHHGRFPAWTRKEKSAAW